MEGGYENAEADWPPLFLSRRWRYCRLGSRCPGRRWRAGSHEIAIVNLELKDTPVTSAIDALFQGTGVKYYIRPGVSGRVVELQLKAGDTGSGRQGDSRCRGTGIHRAGGSIYHWPGRSGQIVAGLAARSRRRDVLQGPTGQLAGARATGVGRIVRAGQREHCYQPCRRPMSTTVSRSHLRACGAYGPWGGYPPVYSYGSLNFLGGCGGRRSWWPAGSRMFSAFRRLILRRRVGEPRTVEVSWPAQYALQRPLNIYPPSWGWAGGRQGLPTRRFFLPAAVPSFRNWVSV